MNNPAEIRLRREVLERKIVQFNRQIDHVRVDMRALQDECTHPDKYTKHHYDGSTSEKCDDCGWSFG